MSSNRILYIDILNVFTSFAVIFLHVNGFWDFNNSSSWIISNIIESIFYFAVPIFFMIAGATLLNYRDKYDTKIFFKRRIKKTVIPYIVWTTLGIIFLTIIGEIQLNKFYPINVLNTYLTAELSLFSGHVYWYILASMSVYLCIPIITLIPTENRQKTFSFIIFAYLILNVLFTFINQLTNGIFVGQVYLSMPLGGDYLLYALIGYYIHTYNLKKHNRIIIYILGLIALLSIIFGTQILSLSHNEIVPTFKGYLNLPCIIYSSSIFLLFRNIKNKNILNAFNKIISPFRNQTFGIYMIHIFIRNVYYYVLNFDRQNVLIVILMSFVVFFTSWLIINLMQKIPIVKKIVP